MTTAIERNSFLNGLSIDNRAPVTTDKAASDKDMFMKLMLAQMKNQNPLNPQDGADFVAQLAQFTQVEGIGKLNTSVQDIATLYRSTQTLQATALVGRSVQVPGNVNHYDGLNSMTGVIPAGQAATNVNMMIKDKNGAVVANYALGDITGSETPLSWDGKDRLGNQMSPGSYTVQVEGLINNKRTVLNTSMNVRVNSVSITDNMGGMKLNLANGTSIGSDAIKQIL